MATIEQISEFLETYAPARLAESWDNVGLLVGDRGREVHRLMTCLTITPMTAAEAIEQQADLIVTHHPFPFHALKRLTSDTTQGRLLLDLIAAKVAVHSPHTAFDSAAEGINQRLAEALGLQRIEALVPHEAGQGTGRFGQLAAPLGLPELARRLKKFLAIDRLQIVGDPKQTVRRAAVACGAAGELLPAALAAGCDAMVLGEARFHTCLEAEAAGIVLLLPGHFASEHFAVKALAEVLIRQFPDLETWASRRERDPIQWID
jgi:dinuclear metal center YbgI/SA1388 family protein